MLKIYENPCLYLFGLIELLYLCKSKQKVYPSFYKQIPSKRIFLKIIIHINICMDLESTLSL